MEKDIWVIADNKSDMLEAQRSINATGSMRAICILSYGALERLLFPCKNMPSLIVLDYEMSKKEGFKSLSLLKSIQTMAGIPLFFMSGKKDESVREECYHLGALAVIKKPFTEVSVERIERMAWQFDVAKSTEKKLERQAMDLRAAREIERLNKQLEARNELLHQVFGRYFSDEVMEKILDHPQGASIGGEKKDMTVMMADLRGFTAMSQRMDSDEMMDLLNYYFGKMIEVIRSYKGTVIELLGDGILAVFGAPITSVHHTQRAIAAAITMQNTMNEINAYCAKRNYNSLEMGIGIHRGIVFIGNIGSDEIMRYNVVGRVVNECARIESYSVGGQVLVSDSTIQDIRLKCTTRELTEIKAKGVEIPIKVHKVTALKGEYACKLKYEEETHMYAVKEPMFVELHIIKGKLVEPKPVIATIEAFSYKSAIVYCEDNSELSVFHDVRIKKADENGRIFFDDVYAKVIQKEDQSIKLHYTYMGEMFWHFLKKLEEETGGA